MRCTELVEVSVMKNLSNAKIWIFRGYLKKIPEKLIKERA